MDSQIHFCVGMMQENSHFVCPNGLVHPKHALCTVEESCDSAWEFLPLTLQVVWTLRTMRFEWRRASAELFHGGGFGHQAFLTTPLLSLSLSPSPASIHRSVPFPWGSQCLAAFTLNIVPLRWIPINPFSSTAARNSILQALNHCPGEKVGELQILRGPLLNPGSYWSKGALIFLLADFFLSLPLLRCLRVLSNMFSLLSCSFLVLLSKLHLMPVIIRLQFG